ncbi:unnamed protein product, partial [Brugia timori]|uniref:NET domain-containing protein n=1 Tax=Brugia timori TaxID=42155 RepID=A0A0R3QAK8_9BILA
MKMQDHGLDSTTTVTGEERRQTSVPLPLERFSDAARIIDGHAHLYLWVMVASYITSVMDAIEKDENEKKTEEEIMKTQKDFTEESSKRTLDDVTSNESSSTTRLFIDEEEHGLLCGAVKSCSENTDIINSGNKEWQYAKRDVGNVDDNVADAQLEYSSESVDITVQAPSVSEPMDQSGTLYYDTSESLENQIHRTCEQEQENITSNVNSEISTDASVHTVLVTANEAEEQGNVEVLLAGFEFELFNLFRKIILAKKKKTWAKGKERSTSLALTFSVTEDVLGNVEQLSAPEVTPEASLANQDDFREILGDIEIPEGVDPAFLAALPEDIRTEVIRDHIRQQRSQRLIQTSANLEAASQANGEVP